MVINSGILEAGKGRQVTYTSYVILNAFIIFSLNLSLTKVRNGRQVTHIILM